MEQQKENNQVSRENHQVLVQTLQSLTMMKDSISKELSTILSKENPMDGKEPEVLTPEEKENKLTYQVLMAALGASISSIKQCMSQTVNTQNIPSAVTCCSEYLHGSILQAIMMKDPSEIDECLERCENTVDSIIALIPTITIATAMEAFNTYDAIIKEQWNERIRQIMDFIIPLKADVDAHTNMINSMRKELATLKADSHVSES